MDRSDATREAAHGRQRIGARPRTAHSAAEALAERARREGNPLPDDAGLTWVWLGAERPPILAGDWNGWDQAEALPWERAGGGVWRAHLQLPADAYVEYAFFRGEERTRDPLSRARIGNGIGDWNHRAWMPEASQVAHRLRRTKTPPPRGTLTVHDVEPHGFAVGPRRRVWLHRPAGYDPATLPLLIALDGSDYLRARTDRVLDLLIHERRMAPVVTAFVQHGGHNARMVEYMGSEMTLAFLVTRVLELARRELGVADPTADGAPGTATIMGPSAAGLMALFAGLRLPEYFGRVLAQSGAWEFGGHQTIAPILVRDGPVRPIRIWMDAGRYEWLFEPNERMAALLEERGYDVTYRRYNGGHNFTAWMEEILIGLPTLLAPS